MCASVIIYAPIICYISAVMASDNSIRVSSVVSKVCPLTPHNNLIRYEDIEYVDFILNEIYGPPACTCTSGRRWKRLAFLNMTNTTQQCPPNWHLVSTPVRGCSSNAVHPSCKSAIFLSHGFNYSHVCGRVIAYQKGTPDAFRGFIITGFTIDQPYVDGISLTHGGLGRPRSHIWTFAATAREQGLHHYPDISCKCTNTNYTWPYEVPPFVGENYFCDTGHRGSDFRLQTIFGEDPLWDGSGCGATSTCCQFNKPPWFCTSLPKFVNDDLELRICKDQNQGDEDIIISLVEIYVAVH